MSTASPLPLQPLPPSTVSQAESLALKQQVANRLAEHRQRRPRAADAQAVQPNRHLTQRESRVADSVAARFAATLSYRDFLEQEAEAATRQAEAAAEVAIRNAEAIAAAQQQLLHEIDQWNGNAAPTYSEPAQIIDFAAAAEAQHAMAQAHHALEPAQASVVTAEVPVVLNNTAAPAAVAADVFAMLAQQPAEAAVALPANLLEFPRQLVAARRARPRLAEGPLRDEADDTPERAQLRIFEVEADAFSTEPLVESGLPVWSSIRLDSHTQPREAAHNDAQLSLAIPVDTAPVLQRCMAFAVDACCVVAAFLVAVAAAACASPELPNGIAAVASAGGALFLLGLLYQLLFFTFSDATPGMRYARIGLCTFADENPSRAAMRKRIFALLLAGIPCGLGIVWATLDDDSLGWHDRISRMYPRAY